jgi:hypothetical protein
VVTGYVPGSGSSASYTYYGGGPVLASEQYRVVGTPTGPLATGGPVSGPVAQAWADPYGASFGRQLGLDLAEQIVYNNAAWEAGTENRGLVEHYYGEGLSTPEKDARMWELAKGEARAPIGYGYYGPRAWANAGHMRGVEQVGAAVTVAQAASVAFRGIAAMRAAALEGAAAGGGLRVQTGIHAGGTGAGGTPATVGGAAGAGTAGGPGLAHGIGFESYGGFLQAVGPAGRGLQWHHIIEQTPGNVSRFGSTMIHNTGNLIRVDAALHSQISGFYSSMQPFSGGMTVRAWLSTMPAAQQQEFGRQALIMFGAL